MSDGPKVGRLGVHVPWALVSTIGLAAAGFVYSGITDDIQDAQAEARDSADQIRLDLRDQLRLTEDRLRDDLEDLEEEVEEAEELASAAMAEAHKAGSRALVLEARIGKTSGSEEPE